MNATKKILVAEDQETEYAMLREILSAEPQWEVTLVRDGQEAMDALCDGMRPDVFLLDLRMPKLDGLEMLQRIRRDPQLRNIKVVVTSGTRDKETILALAKLSISGYLLKPYNRDKTLATLRPLLVHVAADPSMFTKNLLSRTALVVEDGDSERTVLQEIFKAGSGWEMVSAQDGQDALDRLHTGMRPDLLLIDLRMPKIDGITLIQRIREDAALRSLRVVVMSGEQNREEIHKLAKLRISGYLLKPISEAKVKEVLQKTMDNIEEVSESRSAF